jgi:hypothetical protein
MPNYDDRGEMFENGNLIYTYDDGLHWYFADNDELADYLPDIPDEVIMNSRPCPRCGKLPIGGAYDACLGKLKGVKAACCGHGVEKGYISYNNGVWKELPKLRRIRRVN